VTATHAEIAGKKKSQKGLFCKEKKKVCKKKNQKPPKKEKKKKKKKKHKKQRKKKKKGGGGSLNFAQRGQMANWDSGGLPKQPLDRDDKGKALRVNE